MYTSLFHHARPMTTRLLCRPPVGGCLFYVGPKKEEKREVVVDPERRRQVFLESHFTEIGNHLGQKKTVHRIQSRYYWLGIVKDVVDWVSVERDSGMFWNCSLGVPEWELCGIKPGLLHWCCVCMCVCGSLTGRGFPSFKSFLSPQIKMCETCQNAEHNKSASKKIRPIKVESPWEILGLDVYGMYPGALELPSPCLEF